MKFFGLTLDFDPLFTELKSWWDGFLALLPNMVLAIIIVTLGYLVTKWTKKYFDQLAQRLVGDRTVAGLLSSFFTIVVVLAFLFLTLSVLELTGAVQSILAGAGVVGLALGLAFQDPILNLFSGILLSIRRLFRGR